MFTTSASRLSFDGFMSVYVASDDEEEKKQVIELLKAEWVKTGRTSAKPAFYTAASFIIQEASLVKAMEEQGIGRPSTYAPTITTIIARRYVAKENKNLCNRTLVKW